MDLSSYYTTVNGLLLLMSMLLALAGHTISGILCLMCIIIFHNGSNKKKGSDKIMSLKDKVWKVGSLEFDIEDIGNIFFITGIIFLVGLFGHQKGVDDSSNAWNRFIPLINGYEQSCGLQLNHLNETMNHLEIEILENEFYSEERVQREDGLIEISLIYGSEPRYMTYNIGLKKYDFPVNLLPCCAEFNNPGGKYCYQIRGMIWGDRV